jgi:O-antigen/teichoic acid export membrane protein
VLHKPIFLKLKRQIHNAYIQVRKTNVISNFLNLSSIQISNTFLVILLIPIITRRIGIEGFGLMMFAARFSQLAGAVVNYGTNQSGVRDIASNLTDVKSTSLIFYNILLIRSGIFLLFLVVLAGFYAWHINNFLYLLLSVPIVLAEVFNPLYFFIGAEKLKVFNVVNLVSNMVAIAAIILLIKSPSQAVWTNFILGTISSMAYCILALHLRHQFRLLLIWPRKADFFNIIKSNFYLTVNNISVHLQQSIVIFALEQWGTPSLLGAYSLCDRIIGQCRNLLITISTAIYPNAARIYKQSIDLWNTYRKKAKYIITSVFFVGSTMLFFLADFIVYTLSKEHNVTAAAFLRIMAIVPTLSAMNVLNVLDQLLKNNTVNIFRIAVALLLISFAATYILLNSGPQTFTGAFTVIVEACALLMYEYVLKKTSLQHA